MKTSLLTLLTAATLSSQAALVHFDLSPAGSDVAVGLSPSNQVPVVTNSTGFGDEVSGGIVLDTDSLEFSFAIGYGSAAGFANLTGPATAMHIHSPAAPGHNTNVFIDLSPYSFPALNPTNGGVIMGTFLFPTNAVSNLLAGLDYVNIHTALNTNGEIRGQLIPVGATNSPPSISCPPASTVQCGSPIQLTVLVSDPDGDALTVVWAANGVAVQTNSVPASDAAVNLSATINLPLGTNVIAVTATDTATNSSSCVSIITVADTKPPVIVSVSPDRSSLWPPNHKFVTVHLTAQVTGACGPTTWKVVSVTSSEAVKGKGDGNTAPDWIIVDDHTVKLRAERSGKGSGRVYTITVQATGESGNLSAPKSTIVSVPHDQGKGNGKPGKGNDPSGEQPNGNGHSNGNGNSNDDSDKNDNGHGNGKGNGKKPKD